MFELKPIHPDSIEQALEKAHHYRLLNEPGEAESICLDVLDVEPDNQDALVTLLLALTDRLAKGYAAGARQAKAVLPKLKDEYQRAYYAGLICERQAKVRLQQGGPGAGHDGYEWLREAMDWYEKAEPLKPAGNDDAILRWNACARNIMRNHLSARAADGAEPYLE
ncbi:MAG: hypothetical protein HYR56_01570 [Acidobacteria bacterium]|nr:hypothetical protein [Acidobacteriota bacterium]MBI3427082.1 hypothetical protein [Acidobacteriota bacterium]